MAVPYGCLYGATFIIMLVIVMPHLVSYGVGTERLFVGDSAIETLFTPLMRVIRHAGYGTLSCHANVTVTVICYTTANINMVLRYWRLSCLAIALTLREPYVIVSRHVSLAFTRQYRYGERQRAARQ